MMKRTTNQAQGFAATQVEGYFMVSKKASETSIINRLTGSQYRLWHYLMIIQPFADQTKDGERIYRDIPPPAEIGIAIGSNPRTVEKDMNRLEELGLYAKRVVGWQGYNLTAEETHNISSAMKQAKAERQNSRPTKQPQFTGAETECNNKSDLKSKNSKGGYLAANPVKQPLARLNNRESGEIAEDEIAQTHAGESVSAPAISPQTIQIKNQTTHTTNANPTLHFRVCDFLVGDEEEKGNQETVCQEPEIEVDRGPSYVDQLIENAAREISPIGKTGSASAIENRKTRSITMEWDCPGTSEEKLDFLKWKGDLLLKAGKCTKGEARSFALRWANVNPEGAALAFEDWHNERERLSSPDISTTPTPDSVANTIPVFEFKSKGWHEKLVAAYRQGEEAFLGQETWHKNWLDFAKTHLGEKLKG